MYVAYRGTIPSSRFSQGAPPEEMVLWTGPEKHFVRYPLRGKKLYNQVAVFRATAIAKDRMTGGLRMSWTNTLPRRAPRCATESRSWTGRGAGPSWTGRRSQTGHKTGSRYSAMPASHAAISGTGSVPGAGRRSALANCVERYRERLDRAFLAYQEIRSAHTARAQLAARAFGEFWPRMPERLEQRDRLLLQRSHNDYTELDWLYRPRE
jgi:3-hydroxybenzoate 6-monooxygenase